MAILGPLVIALWSPQWAAVALILGMFIALYAIRVLRSDALNMATDTIRPRQHRRRRMMLGLTLLIALLPLAGVARMVNGSDCRNPYFLTRAPQHAVNGSPLPPFAAIIQLAGGPPLSGGEMNTSPLTFSRSVSVRPVTAYHLQAVTASDTQPIYTRALDDDPNYGLTVDVAVTYADGSHEVLRWTTWRYGLVLCPFVIPYGDGPPWRIQVLP